MGAAAAEGQIGQRQCRIPSALTDQLGLAILYAEANPRKGRPRPVMNGLPKGTRKLREVRIPRRRA